MVVATGMASQGLDISDRDATGEPGCLSECGWPGISTEFVVSWRPMKGLIAAMGAVLVGSR